MLDLADHGVEMPGDPVRLVFSLVGGTKLPVPDGLALWRQGKEALADGEHVLWLAIGALKYLDREGAAHTAPLVLWPVTLERTGTGVKLAVSPDRAPRLNDALIAKYELASLAQPSIDLAAVLAAADELCIANPGWSLERSARVIAFSFADLDMWRDLQEHDLTSPDAVPVQWLLGDAITPSLPTANAADLILPLDADGSQTAAIAAAAAGASFVLQGPPGTGKSQTIANILVQCASQGTSVLVVSDRVAALTSISERLASVGLGEVCTIAGQMIDRVSRPHVNAPAGAAVVRTRLAEVAASLDAHTKAMHGVGERHIVDGLTLRPSSLSIYEAMARLIELRTTPRAQLAEADAASIDRLTFERRKRAVTELAEAAIAIEPVATHAWRASALDAWTADGTNRATQALETANDAAALLAAAIAEVTALVPNLQMRTPEQLRAVGALAALAATSPRPGAELLTGPRGRSGDLDEEIALIRARGGGVLDVPRDPVSFIAIAKKHRELCTEVGCLFGDTSQLDATELWTQLKKWTTSMGPLRYIALRTARGLVNQAALVPFTDDASMIIALEALIAERACRAALVAATEPAARWFGALGGDPLAVDLDKLSAALAWVTDLRRAFEQVTVAFGEPGRLTAWRALVAQVAAGDGDHDLLAFAKLADSVGRWEPAMTELAQATGIPLAQLGAGPDHVTALRVQIGELATAASGLAEWTRFHLARRGAVDAGLRDAIVAIERGDLVASDLALAWERATLLVWADAAVKRTPELSHFDGGKLHLQVTSYADLDRGAMAVMRGRLPKLAPVVLATPQAVARCNLPMFDLVIFDEASRLPVAHALGALVRSRAAIVVGDVRQPVPSDGHGLLDVALSAGMPELVLETHYRSRHHDLFAFANRRYYFDLVAVHPAAGPSALQWRRVDGAADPTGANRAEADEIIADLKTRDHGNAMIVTMSRAQQHLVEDLLDTAGIKNVLVGTPDRMQGEERELVYLSLGDQAGALSHPGAERWLDVAVTRARGAFVIVSSFGPEDIDADAPAAARGVAELLAFARDGAPVVEQEPASAVTAAIARALEGRGWSVRHRVGSGSAAVELAVVDPDDPTKYVLAIEHDGIAYAEADGTRERDRLRTQQLEAMGWRTHRVWVLDWWMDPERETSRAHGAIVAAVAASRVKKGSGPVAAAAKRRRVSKIEIDRTQPMAMIDVASGPNKVSSIDDGWVSGPAAGSAPTLAARADGSGPKSAPVKASGSGPTLAGSSSQPIRIARGTIPIGKYVAAAIPCGRRVPDDMFAGRHAAELGKVVEQVLAAEAPVHIEVLARRTAAYFGVGKINARIVEQVRSVLGSARATAEEPDIIWRADQDPSSVLCVRVAGANPIAARDITEIPLSEVAAAARIVVERASGMPRTDLVRDCARLLGFARITDKVTARVSRGVELATARELIAIENDRAHLLS
ncbi:MAG: DUF3320 domain-containing protein [Kofleriaceae bacterium]